jgi:integrating conjugative element protein (TIGR03757 family)
MLCLAQPAMAQTITAYTDSQTRLHNVPPATTIYELDAGLHIEDAMSVDLPPNTREAEQILRARMQSVEWRAMEAKLTRSAEGLAKAKALGVTKIPAVVVDDRYVVYGVTDVTQALQMIQAREVRHEAD